MLDADITAPPVTPARAGLGKASYLALALLTLIYLCSSIDRMIISTIAEPLKRDFGLSDTQLGVLTGLFFSMSFAVCGIPLGMLADRVNRPRLLAALLVIWSALTFASSAAQSYFMLALARIGVGGSEAGASPTSMSIISDLFPPERRGVALSFFYMSTPIGTAIGLGLGGYLAAEFGWRTVFMVAGIPGLILAVLLLLFVKDPGRGNFESVGPVSAAVTADKPSLMAALRVLRDIPAIPLVMLAGMSLVVGQAGSHAFITPFLMRVHGITIAEAGIAGGMAQLVPGVLGVLAGGFLADRMARRGGGAGLFMIGVVMLVTAPTSIAAFLMPDWHVAMALLAFSNFMLALYYGTHFSMLLSLTPAWVRGTITGIHTVALTLMGYGAGPVITGAASDFYDRAGIANPLRWAEVTVCTMFLLAALFYFAAGLRVRHSHRSALR
ncbi:spinster family MFS transporter [Novosphingobium lindaniclasticum]|nr:MFS transporter [Novosphingobium lindaniclasticum]